MNNVELALGQPIYDELTYKLRYKNENLSQRFNFFPTLGNEMRIHNMETWFLWSILTRITRFGVDGALKERLNENFTVTSKGIIINGTLRITSYELFS